MTKKRTMWLAGICVGGLLAVVVCMGAVAAHVTGVAQTEAVASQQRCPPNGPGGGADTAQLAQQVAAVLSRSPGAVQVAGLSDPQEQLLNAKVIVATGIQMHVPARGQVIALATALQESALRNLDHGDRDSVGLFQQRPSQGWGTRAQLMDPVYASQRFYRALTSVNGWDRMEVTEAAQKVQKSGNPRAYAKHERLATALQHAIAATLGTAPAGTAWSATGQFGGAACVPAAGGSPAGTVPAGQVPKGYQIPPTAKPAVRAAIQWALGQLGTPYQWGGTCTNPHGTNPKERCDCSSLVQRAYGVAGINISRTTYTQVHEGKSVPANAGAIQAGDLLFTRGTTARPEHVALALGGGLLLQAPRTGRLVEIAQIASQGQLLAVRRLA